MYNTEIETDSDEIGNRSLEKVSEIDHGHHDPMGISFIGPGNLPLKRPMLQWMLCYTFAHFW